MSKLQDIQNALDKVHMKEVGCILISCGVNDLEDQSGQEVANGLIALVGRIRQRGHSVRGLRQRGWTLQCHPTLKTSG